MRMIKIYDDWESWNEIPWNEIPAGFTGIAWWPRYNSYEFFENRMRHRLDGPCVVHGGNNPNADLFAINGAPIKPIPFELQYMLLNKRLYTYNMINDYKRLEEIRSTVFRLT